MGLGVRAKSVAAARRQMPWRGLSLTAVIVPIRLGDESHDTIAVAVPIVAVVPSHGSILSEKIVQFQVLSPRISQYAQNIRTRVIIGIGSSIRSAVACAGTQVAFGQWLSALVLLRGRRLALEAAPDAKAFVLDKLLHKLCQPGNNSCHDHVAAARRASVHVVVGVVVCELVDALFAENVAAGGNDGEGQRGAKADDAAELVLEDGLVESVLPDGAATFFFLSSATPGVVGAW